MINENYNKIVENHKNQNDYQFKNEMLNFWKKNKLS